MKLMQFLLIPIIVISLTHSVSAHSWAYNYDLMEVVSLDVTKNKIVLKELGALDRTLFARSDILSTSKMLCSNNHYSKKTISVEDVELDCDFIKVDLEEINDEPTGGFLTYLTSLFNVKEVKPDPPATRLSEHPTVSSGDYAVYEVTDELETTLIMIDPSTFDYVKTLLSYNRENWSFNSSTSPLSTATKGWYTGVTAVATDVDHVVSLKDAYLSGGNSWSADEKRTFANDPSNHVAALPYVNRTLKGSKPPLKFINHINYVIRSAFASGKCLEYVDRYVQIKEKYKLNFIFNRIDLAKDACR